MAPSDVNQTRHFDNAKAAPDSAFVLLDVSDSGVTLPDDLGDSSIDISQQNLFVFAEVVTITDDIVWHGHNLIICCSSLNLGRDSILIDVSGRPADGVAASAAGSGSAGNAGGSGGSVSLYVEQMNDGIVGGLRLNATGAKGGDGGNTADAKAFGGVGGSGGSGGSISYLWKSPTGRVFSTLMQCHSLPWCEALDRVSGLMKAMPESEESSTLQAMVDRYGRYRAAINACYVSAGTLLKRSGKLSATFQKTLQDFMAGIKSQLSAQGDPDLADDVAAENVEAFVKILKDAVDELGEFDVDENHILTKLNALGVVDSASTASPFRTAMDEVTDLLIGQLLHTSTIVGSHCANAPGGGGAGGSGTTITSGGQPGPVGEDPAASIFKEVRFLGRAADLKIATAVAFPDQCQMLLNKANYLFFKNTGDSKKEASILYRRLMDRLAFWPALSAQPTSTSTSSEGSTPTPTPLELAYEHLERVLKVTVSWREQIGSIYNQAQSFNNQIVAGCDMFGHNPLWVPRLNASYYTGRAVELMGILKTMEDEHKNMKDEQAALSDITSGKTAAQSAEQDAQMRVKLLTETNGPLSISADTISHFTPLLTRKVANLSADIKAKFTFDTGDALDALSNIAMAPSIPLALFQGGKIFYDGSTTVKDSAGVKVNKDYVVSEFDTAGDNLGSLDQAFSARADHTVQTGDPGGMKLLAAADRIESLYEEFKANIPADDGKELRDSLDELKHLATTRNNAVVAYNSALELLKQASADEVYHYKQVEAYADQAAKEMNPALPSILLWLQRTRDGYALEIMRLFDYASRAIYYWGLELPASSESTPSATAMIPVASPGPLKDSLSLANDLTALNSSFETALGAFAGSAPDHFPPSSPPSTPQHGIQGDYYRLNAAQRQTLQTKMSRDTGKQTTTSHYYTVTIPLKPGVLVDSEAREDKDKDKDKGRILMAERANIRLDRVRLWLVGASVEEDEGERRPLHVVITQLGDEVVEKSTTGEQVRFAHDPVVMGFRYDVAGLTAFAQCGEGRVLGTQMLPNYYYGGGGGGGSGGSPALPETTIAAVGPWSTWMFELREQENPSLDLGGLTDAYIEFGGFSSPFVLSQNEK
ncbi:hypothetical protein B0T16DRAFT_453737 [Cercophora newfieldiana]|uniref:Uncharacterized protein n=1 Tax=Cercophora newfieldiana TaxID=92897 RepID=A0AA39YEM8_9PEZI|nr:hypothetical protein B0T16DRAFT_453737 [Cercophora newfieldiana]